MRDTELGELGVLCLGKPQRGFLLVRDHLQKDHISNVEDPLFIEIDGTIEICSNFAAIGTGMYIAEAAFFLREHTYNETLGNAIYHVYEAMRTGAHAPGVGERFNIGICGLDEESGRVLWWQLEHGYFDVLEKKFKKFGPKKLTRQPVRVEFLLELSHFVETEQSDTETTASKESSNGQ